MKIIQFFKNRQYSEATESKYRKWMRILWGLVILSYIGFGFLMFTLSKQDLPSFQDLENPKSNIATEILADNLEEIGRWYIEDRVPIQYSDINPTIIDALISTEDERYFEHSGIDGRALVRVIIKTVFLGKKGSGGGSTITQQLAKLLYSNRNMSNMSFFQKATYLVSIKLKEWITAVKLEKKYTKEEILSMYLNKFNFNYGAYGIKAASEVYFSEDQSEISTDKAAMLIGMLQNPSKYNPKRFPKKTKYRRNTVLNQMKKNGKIDAISYDSLSIKEIDMSDFKRRSHSKGVARYFLMELRKDVNKILADENISKADGTNYNIYKDGLKVYTTINLEIQKYAESAMKEHMIKVQEKFFKIWKDKDPWTYRDEKTTEKELEIRKRSLLARLRESGRYQNLKKKILGELISNIQSDFDIELKGYDIDRMLENEKNKGHLTQLLNKKLVSTEKVKKYKKIIRSKYWSNLKTKFAELNKIADKEFSIPVEMKIFTYSPSGEKDTIMSPLDSIKYHRMILQTGIMAVDPHTGYVKAWIGGVDYQYFQYDHIRSSRQVGSTFKPFVYASAIALQGLSPCDRVKDMAYTIEPGEGSFYLKEPWTPTNSNNIYTGKSLTLMEGLKQSKNTVSVYLMKLLQSPEPVRDLVRNTGIDVDKKRRDGEAYLPSVPSICLGSADLNVLEMTGAYTTFANNGTSSKPIYIKKIVDKNGKLLFESYPEERRVLEPKYNYTMVQMLRNVAAGAPDFFKLKSDIGGKTGTTNKHVDGWFMTITPDLVIGTWVGGEDPWIRFLNISEGQGARMARPFAGKFLRLLESDTTGIYNKSLRFPIPEGETLIITDCDEYEKEKDSNLNKEYINNDSYNINPDSFDDNDSTDFNEDEPDF